VSLFQVYARALRYLATYRLRVSLIVIANIVLAAITIASLTMGSKIGSGFLIGLGGALLALTSALIALLVVLTLKAIGDGKVFIPE